MAKPKKHKIHISSGRKFVFEIIGVTTEVSIVKFVYDINRLFPIKFILNREPIPLENNSLLKKLPLYVSLERNEEDPVVYIFPNQYKIETKTSNDLFAIETLHFFFSSLKKYHFFMLIPSEHDFNRIDIIKKFNPGYFVHLETLEMSKLNPFPFFPVTKVNR